MNWLRKLEKICCNEKLIFNVSVAIGCILSILSVIFIYDYIYRGTAGVYAYSAREIANSGFASGWEYRVLMLNILLSAGVKLF